MKHKKSILLFTICLLLLTGCDLGAGGGEEVPSAEQVLTSAAETVFAALSLTPQATETSTPSATATATSTLTPSPSATSSYTVAAVSNPVGGNTGGQASGCDNATFVSDVTIPDGTQFAPGTAFTKTWRMQNSGSCAWTTAYSVFFVNGDSMSGVSPQLLTTETAAGFSLEISLELVAPATAGTYTGYWQLKNAAGEPFGHNFYVQIVVTGDATSTATTTETPTATATGDTSTPTSTTAATSTSTTAPTSTSTSTTAPTSTNTTLPTATDTPAPTATDTTAPTATDTPTP